MRSHNLLFVYSSACTISSLAAGQSRRFGKRFLLPILSLLVLLCSSLAGVASAGVNTWTTNGPEGGVIVALAIDPSTPSTLYAGAGGGGVFKSSNGGASWSPANMGLTNTVVTALKIDPSAPATLYVGTDGGGVFKSSDGAGSWTAVNTGLTNARVFALAIDPSAPATLYAGTFGAGVVFKTTNAGGGWTAINTGLRETVVWSLAVDPSTPSTLYAGTYIGLFRSTNGGGSWSAINRAHIDSVFALAIDPSAPATLYSGWYDHGIFKSTNGGDGWATINAGLTNTAVFALAIDPSSPATLYAGTEGGVFKSTNAGGNWIAMNSGLSNIVVYALAIDPSNTATLYAGTDGGGVFKSSNGGTWLLPSSAHSNGANGAFYTTNVAVANVGAAPASFTMKFLGNNQDGSSGPEQTFNLESGKSVTYLDVLGSVFHQTSGFGAIRITSDTASLNVVSVTSTAGFGGTLSQTIPAVFSSNLIPAGSSRSILYIREGDGFRSNLVLASNADVSTTVDAALVSPAGATLAAKSYPVLPNGMTQINRIVRDMGFSGSITGARLVLSSSTPNAAFTAFASVIDEITNDPTAVEAR
jgi:photosystem II stability/assembly factor-like uncharacterized protein